MKSSKIHVKLGVLAASLALASQALAVTVNIPVEQARTYCNSYRLVRPTSATHTNNGLGVAYASDKTMATGGNETVWQVVGTLGDASQPGEAYCGFLSVGGTGFPIGGGVFSEGLEDCVGVLRYAIASTSGVISGARLAYAGARVGGVAQTIVVTNCDNVPGPSTVDNEPVQGGGPVRLDTDCVVDRDDFAGGSFAGIHDVLQRRANNNVGLIGGVSDLNRGEAFVVRNIELGQAFIDKANALRAAGGGTLSVIVRCADDAGHDDGFLGRTDNVLVLHDPGGFGFGGPFGDIPLQLDY